MTELAARELYTSLKSFAANNVTGTYANAYHMWLGDKSTSSQGKFKPHSLDSIEKVTDEYLPGQVYYEKLEKPYSYSTYLNAAVGTFSTWNQLPISTSVSVVEKMAKLAIRAKPGIFTDKEIVNPYVFDRDAIVWITPEGKEANVNGLLNYIKAYKESEALEGRDWTWFELATDFQNQIKNSREYGTEQWWLSSDNKD